MIADVEHKPMAQFDRPLRGQEEDEVPKGEDHGGDDCDDGTTIEGVV